MPISLPLLFDRYALLGLYIFAKGHQHLEDEMDERRSVYQQLTADVDKIQSCYLLIISANWLLDILTCKHFYQSVKAYLLYVLHVLVRRVQNTSKRNSVNCEAHRLVCVFYNCFPPVFILRLHFVAKVSHFWEHQEQNSLVIRRRHHEIFTFYELL